jgi:hypothetical protein
MFIVINTTYIVMLLLLLLLSYTVAYMLMCCYEGFRERTNVDSAAANIICSQCLLVLFAILY